MNVRPRSAAVMVALLLAALAAVAAPASASPVKATIRVEGLTGTVIPTTTLATDARPIVSVDGVAHQPDRAIGADACSRCCGGRTGSPSPAAGPIPSTTAS